MQDNKPEKVRLLDKLLTKYKGREPHLIQKLSDRYDRNKETDSTVKEKVVEAASDNKIEEPQNKNAIDDDDGFQNFGAFPRVTSKDVKNAFDAWPPMEDNNDPNKSSSMDEDIQVNKESDDASHSSYTESDFSGDSIDGTSPAVIAQVSELLNYVYGKTSVPGQIDRVSTIMRAYEGREAILLELLETKALLKANEDKEASNNLPAALRNNPALQKRQNTSVSMDADNPTISSPVSGITTTYSDEKDVDISSSSIGRTTGTSISTPSPSNSNKSKVRQPLLTPLSFPPVTSSLTIALVLSLYHRMIEVIFPFPSRLMTVWTNQKKIDGDLRRDLSNHQQILHQRKRKDFLVVYLKKIKRVMMEHSHQLMVVV